MLLANNHIPRYHHHDPPPFTSTTSLPFKLKKNAPTRRRKYTGIRHHYLYDHLDRQTIHIQHIASKHMLADLFTKPLGRQRYLQLRDQLNICAPPTQQWLCSDTRDCQTAHYSTDSTVGSSTSTDLETTAMSKHRYRSHTIHGKGRVCWQAVLVKTRSENIVAPKLI